MTILKNKKIQVHFSRVSVIVKDQYDDTNKHSDRMIITRSDLSNFTVSDCIDDVMIQKFPNIKIYV